MKWNLRSVLVAAATLLPAVAGLAAEDMVLRWTHVLQSTLRVDTTAPGPTWGSRNYAMVHVAIYEAVNSIQMDYLPFYEYLPAAPGASLEAATAQAAHDVLTALYPAQATVLSIQLANSLGSLNALPAVRRDAGIAVGKAAAALVLAHRANDGATNGVTYTPGNLPGDWRPDPLHPTQVALGANWGSVVPFTLASPAQFRVPPPPALTSPEYAAAFDEVRRMGSRNRSERTPDQTEAGIFWGYDRGGLGPPAILFAQITESVSRDRGYSLVDNARLFALVSVAMADAGIACCESKYFYNHWRPIAGIREADTDGNSATAAETDWEPLGAPNGGPPRDFTPPFPAYPSGHATFGAAIFRILELVSATDQIALTVRSDELPGVERHFTSFSQAAAENARSRIYLGVHWSYDDVQGRALGRNVADHLFAARFAPLLHMTRTGGELELSFPNQVRSHHIEQNRLLQSGGWIPMAQDPAMEGPMQLMRLPMAEAASFYRLGRK